MKYLRKYKLFESEEVDLDDIIEPGHSISWNDIRERIIYLNDVGFNLDEESKIQYFIDQEGDKVNLTKADKSVTEIKMIRNIQRMIL